MRTAFPGYAKNRTAWQSSEAVNVTVQSLTLASEEIAYYLRLWRDHAETRRDCLE
jgi:hypothetical protein